ncbi:MAG: hypothetical protein ACF8OB_05660, partial [Phycisphaeraceae bacterium JB051]
MPTTIPMQNDISNSLKTIEMVSTKFNLYFLLVMTIMSGSLLIAGFIQLFVKTPNALDQVSDPVMFIAVGVLGFTLFYPWYMVFFFSRHFLLSIKNLEQENLELRKQISDLSESSGL